MLGSTARLTLPALIAGLPGSTAMVWAGAAIAAQRKQVRVDDDLVMLRTVGQAAGPPGADQVVG